MREVPTYNIYVFYINMFYVLYNNNNKMYVRKSSAIGELYKVWAVQQKK